MRLRRRPSIDTEAIQENWQPRLYVRLIAIVLLAAYAVAFVLENRKSVSLHFVFATAKVSLVWLILLGLAVGFVAGILLSQLERRRRGDGAPRSSPASFSTPSAISSGETKLKASRSDARRRYRRRRSRCPSRT